MKYLGPKTDATNVATQGDVDEAAGGPPLSSAAPDAITPDQTGAAGTSTDAARADHVHEINAAAPSSDLTATTTNAEGSGTSFARSDHSHAITTGSASSITGTNATGTSASLARADHNHAYGNGSIATAALADGAVTAAKMAADTLGKAQTIDNKTAAYTLLTADAGKVITVNSASAVNVTINGSLDLAVGQRIDVIQTGAGQLTFAPSSATVNGTPGLKTRAQYSAATVLCTGTDTYLVIGDLAA